MANIMKNRINTVLSQNAINLIGESLKTVIEQLPEKGAITLEEGDRHSLESLDVDNKAFVEDAIAEVTSRGKGIIPEFITPQMMTSDLVIYSQLDRIENDVMDVLQRIRDMKRIAASEAKGVANVVYGVFGTAADAGLPGAQAAYDKMKPRFKDNGAGAPKKELPGAE
ncbi:MAG: hypothetical protein WC756_01410 [Taibaiella sp.]|jgi:hypothetical protein